MGFLDRLFKKNWRSYVAEGDQLAVDGEHGLALQEYRVALKAFDGTPAEREELDAKVGKVRAELCRFHLDRALSLMQAGQFERASNAMDSATSQSSTERERADVEAAGVRLRALERGEVVDEVAAAFAHAEVVSDEDGAKARFAILLGGLEDGQAEHYESLGPKFRVGWLALQEGRFEDAKQQLGEVRELHPKDPFVLIECARAWLALEQMDEAVQAAAQADKHARDNIYVLLYRAEVLWAAEDYETAETVLQRAHDLDEEDGRVFRAIGEHALRCGDHGPGIEAVEFMLQDTPGDVSLLRMAAQLHQAAGHLDVALGYYEGVNALRWNMDPESRELIFDPVAALGAAQIYIEQEKRPERVIDLLHAMLTVTEGASAAQMQMGIARAHLLKKRKKDAREALESARDLLDEGHPLREEVLKRLAEV